MTRKSHCPDCQATRTINRYDNQTVYSIVTKHQPQCPRVAGRGTSTQPMRDPHALGPGGDLD